MEKVYVKLRDRGSVIYDETQDATIVGDRPVYVTKSPRIRKALASSVLVELSEEAAKAEIERLDAEDAERVIEETERAAHQKEAKALKAIKKVAPELIGEDGKLKGGEQVDVKSIEVVADAVVTEEDKAPILDVTDEPAPAAQEDNAPAPDDADAADEDKAPADADNAPEAKVSYMMQTNEQLTAELDARNIDRKGATKKAEYAALLEMDDDSKKK